MREVCEKTGAMYGKGGGGKEALTAEWECRSVLPVSRSLGMRCDGVPPVLGDLVWGRGV